MAQLTESGRRLLTDLSQRYGLSFEAVEAMAGAVARGGGTMAQFNISELGGSGQWMAGGMTMVGDMFDHALKARVDSLCNELAGQMASHAVFTQPQTVAGAAWWPDGLGEPASVGGQNSTRYAYFPQAHRIAFDPGEAGALILLDTGDHTISGWSQQQSGASDIFFGITFSSQYGQFPLSSLPRVDASSPSPVAGAQQADLHTDTAPDRPPEAAATIPKDAPGNTPEQAPETGLQSDPVGMPGPAAEAPAEQAPPPPQQTPPAVSHAPPATASSTAGLPQQGHAPAVQGTADEILKTIERLAALRDAGALTDAEFTAKKVELLQRL